MTKLKEALTGLWAYILLGLGALIGVLLYVLNIRNKELDAAKAEIDLADTQKKADILEVEIKAKKDQQDLNKKQVKTLDDALDHLTQARKDIKKEGDLTDKEKEDYWNKK